MASALPYSVLFQSWFASNHLNNPASCRSIERSEKLKADFPAKNNVFSSQRARRLLLLAFQSKTKKKHPAHNDSNCQDSKQRTGKRLINYSQISSISVIIHSKYELLRSIFVEHLRLPSKQVLDRLLRSQTFLRCDELERRSRQQLSRRLFVFIVGLEHFCSFEAMAR